MVCVSDPAVPVTVTGIFCCATELSTVKVRTLEVVAGFVANDAVTPLGKVEVTARLTAPVKPPASVILMVVVPVPPGLTSTSLRELVSQKPVAYGPARSSIKLCPLALPQPVARS